MKIYKLIISISLLSLIIVAASCRKDEKPSVGFTMKATGASESSSNAPSQEPAFTSSVDPSTGVPLRFIWNDGWIYITRLEFSARLIKPSVGEIKQDPEIHVEWEGNQKVDLFDETKIFALLEIPDGNYQDVSLSMTSARINNVVQPNFYFAGIFEPGIDGTPISVAVTQEFTINMEFENGTINAQSGNFLDGRILVSLNNLFNGISSMELSKAELTEGAILISEMHNQDLYMKILANLLEKYIDENAASLAWHFHIKPY